MLVFGNETKVPKRIFACAMHHVSKKWIILRDRNLISVSFTCECIGKRNFKELFLYQGSRIEAFPLRHYALFSFYYQHETYFPRIAFKYNFAAQRTE